MARNRLISLEQTRDGISDGYSPDTLESLFHRAMVAIYDYVLLERRYDANRYLHLLESDGGVMTAKDFLNSPGFGPGFEGLWQQGPLEKTLEYLVLQTQFSCLFTETEKETARNRLLECGYIQDASK
jgi:hypothetical protein